MTRGDTLLILAGISGGLALTLSLGLKLISPMRFAQGLGGGLIGLALARVALAASGADHG